MSKHQILDAFKRNDLTPVFSLYSEDFRVQQTEASCLMAPDYTHTDSGVRILISKQKLEQHNLQLWHTYDSTCEEINDKYFLWKVNIQNNICRTNLTLLTPWVPMNSRHIEFFCMGVLQVVVFTAYWDLGGHKRLNSSHFAFWAYQDFDL